MCCRVGRWSDVRHHTSPGPSSAAELDLNVAIKDGTQKKLDLESSAVSISNVF